MEFVRLSNIKDPYFTEAWDLYKNSFPLEERRTKKTQLLILRNPNYHFEIILHENTFLGLLFWWSFEDLRFIEHFAISRLSRSKGMGNLVLERFKNRNELPILLEVDIPDQPMKHRRIKFYQRLGFHLNHHFYQQPPLHKKHQALTLYVISYPHPISVSTIKHFKNRYHPIIYRSKTHNKKRFH